MANDVLGLGQTHIGLRRINNEDAFVISPELGLFLVCDGMGGHAGGEVAAAIATSAIQRVVRDRSDVINRVGHDPTLSPELVPILANAVSQACREVYDRATSDSTLAGMGCTATGILVVGDKAAMAHVGDTRLYLVRNGEAHQLSSDHTLAAELVRQGTVAPGDLFGHPQSHVLTRVLGPQPLVDVETLPFDVLAGDTLILCSDGLGDYIPSTAWIAEQVREVPTEELPDVLIDFANASGGRDNSTVIVVTVAEAETGQQASRRWPQPALDVLGSSFLFSSLSLAQLVHVLNRCETLTYNPGDVVKRQGDIQDELLVIVSGTLRVANASGEFAVVGPGQHLGEGLVLRPRPVRAGIMATERAQVLALRGANLVDLASRRPWLGVELLSRLVERLSGELDGLAAGDDRTTPGFGRRLL